MDAAERLQEQLAAIAKDEHMSLDTLRVAVCDFVDAMKSEDQSPERVIITAKRAAAAVGLLPTQEQDMLHRSARADQVITEVVRWCIDRYYQMPAPN